MENFIQVGAVANTHGIRGEVKVFPTTDDSGRYKKLKEVVLDTGKERKVLQIDGVKFFKQMVIVKFHGIDSMDAAEPLKGAKLYVTRENAVELKEDEYFYADLIGLTVMTEDGTALGTIREILPTGANDVYVVAKEQKKDLLIPAIKECIKEVDVNGGRMVVRLLPGLQDMNE